MNNLFRKLIAGFGVLALCVLVADDGSALTSGQRAILFGRSSLWTPLNLGGTLVAWWDAQKFSSLTFNSTTVSAWTDRVSGISETQSTGASQPGYSATARNGKPGLTFSGAQVLFAPTLSTNLPTGSGPISIAVAAFNNSAANIYAYDYGTNFANQHLAINAIATTTLISLYTGSGATQYSAAESWQSQDRFSVMTLASNGATGNWIIDGKAPEPFTVSPAVSITGNNTFGNGGSLIGAFISGGTAFWNGTIQQVLIFNKVLTANQLACLAGWESWYDGKNGSNLPSGSLYKNSPPTTSSNCS